MGCRVHITSDLGGGFPDLVCAIGRNLYLIEVKDGKKSPSYRKLTPLEAKFHIVWEEHVVIINSVEEAIEFVNTERL